MELKKLLDGLDNIKIYGDQEKEINSIQNYSGRVNNGDLFIAIKGFKKDGHDFINEAIDNGASAIMIDKDRININNIDTNKVTVIEVPNTREGLAISSANYFNNPSDEFSLIGITGTNGKTTTTYMIKEILEKAGKKVGLIGTIAIYINGEKIKDSERTTPESIEIQKLFRKMADNGVEYVIMEVSSQGLKLNRVDGCNFDISLFTNFSEDHISPNEHPDLDDYYNSKLKLFEKSKIGITNADDSKGIQLMDYFPNQKIITYGIKNKADQMADKIKITATSSEFTLMPENKPIYTDIPGNFSVYNALAATTVALELGIDLQFIKEGLRSVTVPGRFELVDNDLNIPIYIDFAHSPNSLENILSTVKNFTKGRLISVFGCGGDRDSSKRAIMGKISGNIADISIITTDNPRSENPNKIIRDIVEGIRATDGIYETESNRTHAIERAIRMAQDGDIIVLAGKGHELYQEIEGYKYDYNERDIIKEIIDRIVNE